MSKTLKWGILGTGNIAAKFAEQLPSSKTGRLHAVGSRTADSADAFGETHGIANRYGSYQGVLDDPDVDAVYISLPNHLHADWTVRCARAGKHILCEKPFTLNHAEAMTAIQAAKANGVFLMEAFMYRCHPLVADVVRRIRAGEVGEVRFIEARFAYTSSAKPENVRWQNALGGGAMLDLGGYCMSMTRLLAGAALDLDGPAEPMQIKGFAHLGDTGVDDWATATLRFEDDILANLYVSQRVGAQTAVTVYGAGGHIVLHNPWFPGRNGEPGTYTLAVSGKDAQEISIDSPAPLYANEADVLAAHRDQGQAPAPCMTWADTLGNMLALDTWRREVGLVFAPEKPETLRGPIAAAAVARNSDARMTYGQLPGLDKPVSRLVLGTMGHVFRDLPHTCAMADRFFAAGGNCFDTAFVYGGGMSERLCGQWLASRGVRDQCVVICKGAHTPHCDPASIREQLLISLERMGLDYADLYFMHRDNLEIPVGEFVDVLNELKDQGLIRVFGGSNWTTERLQATRDYAAAKGKTGFDLSSPNFSLARWNETIWSGCITATDEASRAWYAASQMALFAWSSQAQGFLTGRYAPADRERLGEDSHAVRIWFSDDNFERLARVRQLAGERRVPLGVVSLAYVLNQPQNLYALTGAHTLDELDQSLAAVELKLSADEVAWLNLERAAR